MATPASRQMLAERLRPARLEDLVGNARARADLRSWAEGWRAGTPHQRRAAILCGPPGVGKTSAALALAADLGWSVVEMNASDARNADAIEKVAGRAAGSRSFGLDGTMRAGSRTLILLDEADCLTGRVESSARPAPKPVPWKDFLHGRYGGVEALNRGWGLGAVGAPPPFSSWEEVPRLPGRGRWAAIPSFQRDVSDWRTAAPKTDLTDRGGLGAIARLVKETRQPLVLTVNDDRTLMRYSPVFRAAAARINFYPLTDEEVHAQLIRIARREGYAVDTRAIDAIVARVHGDFRGALNDLDAIWPLSPGPAQVSVLGPRDRSAEIAEFVAEALSAARFYRNVEVQSRIDATPDDLEPWVEENLARAAPDADHRWSGFRRLAYANLLLARARRARIYGLWSSASEILTGGVGLALRDQPARAIPPTFPVFLAEMGRSKIARALREQILAKLGPGDHLSRQKLREGVLDYFEEVFGRAGSGERSALEWRNLAREIVRQADLTPEEAAYLAQVEPDSEAVERLFAEPEMVAGRPAPVAPPEPPRTSRDRAQRSLTDFGGDSE